MAGTLTLEHVDCIDVLGPHSRILWPWVCTPCPVTRDVIGSHAFLCWGWQMTPTSFLQTIAACCNRSVYSAWYSGQIDESSHTHTRTPSCVWCNRSSNDDDAPSSAIFLLLRYCRELDWILIQWMVGGVIFFFFFIYALKNMLLDPNVGTRHLLNLLLYLFYCMGCGSPAPPDKFFQNIVFSVSCVVMLCWHVFNPCRSLGHHWLKWLMSLQHMGVVDLVGWVKNTHLRA